MRIDFDQDNSFLELIPKEDNKLTFIMCGRKSYREVTMSSADLSDKQVLELITFLSNWLDERNEEST